MAITLVAFVVTGRRPLERRAPVSACAGPRFHSEKPSVGPSLSGKMIAIHTREDKNDKSGIQSISVDICLTAYGASVILSFRESAG